MNNGANALVTAIAIVMIIEQITGIRIPDIVNPGAIPKNKVENNQ